MLQQSVVVVEVYLFVETEARVSTVTVILWIKPKCNNRLLIWLAVFEQKLKTNKLEMQWSISCGARKKQSFFISPIGSFSVCILLSMWVITFSFRNITMWPHSRWSCIKISIIEPQLDSMSYSVNYEIYHEIVIQ